MNTLSSSRKAKKVPQLALRFGALADGASNWCDGCDIRYLGRKLILRLSTHQGGAELNGHDLHLPLPPEASARQIQDSAEAWLRQQCMTYVETMLTRFQEPQLVPTTWGGRQAGDVPQRVRRVTIQLSFATRSPWIAAEDADTLRCNWRLIELAPAVIDQHLLKALGQLATLRTANTTTDMFGALPA